MHETSTFVFLNKKTRVQTQEIVFLEGNVNYTIVHFEQRNPLMLAITLKKVELLLKDYGFIRVHKRFIVNMNYADNTLLSNSLTLSMNNVKVSRRKRHELKARLRKAS